MTNQRTNLVDRAKRGDAQAIATIMNRHLQPKGITAKTTFNEGVLQVMLEAAELPNQQALTKFVRQGVTNLKSELIQTVQVCGKQVGEDFPGWNARFQLLNSQESSFAQNNPVDAETLDSQLSSSSNIQPSKPLTSRIQFEGKPPCPPTYLTPSILVTLFAFLPVGVVAIVFASQVESKYAQNDHAGAQSSSKTAKTLCIAAGAIAAPIYLLVFLMLGLSIFSSSNQANKAKESEAKLTVGTFSRLEQSFYLLENNRFASTLDELQTHDEPQTQIPSETENYSYKLSLLDENSVQITATSRKNGLKSYTSAVFAVKTEPEPARLTVTKTCQSNQPSNTPPAMPTLVGSDISCASGSSETP